MNTAVEPHPLFSAASMCVACELLERCVAVHGEVRVVVASDDQELAVWGRLLQASGSRAPNASALGEFEPLRDIVAELRRSQIAFILSGQGQDAVLSWVALHATGTEAGKLLLRCAEVGFMPSDADFVAQQFEDSGDVITAGTLLRRDYRIRLAQAGDLASLKLLESACWPPGLRMSSRTLSSRIRKYAQGQLVVEQQGQVTAVAYSQRITDVDDLARHTAATVDGLHRNDGRIVQLLALNVSPAHQHQQLGAQLLEFALQLAAVMPGAQCAVGVTRCKDAERHGATDPASYVRMRNEQGRLLDTVLRLHELHGARIVGVIEGYRPRDIANQGCGVLVSYADLSRRQLPRPAEDVPRARKVPAAEPAPRMADIVSRLVREVLGASRESAFAEERPLMEMGLDSADLIDLGERIGVALERDLPASFFFEHNSARRIADALCAHDGPATAAPATGGAAPSGGHEPIAIIGVSCRLPGGVASPAQFWQALEEGRDLLSTLPSSRWTWPKGIDPASTHAGIDRGGFVDAIERFDAELFRISPWEARLMDPQQRLLLELAWDCIEDAGLAPGGAADSAMGVYIGASGSDYELLLNERSEAPEAHYALSVSSAVLANRLSYFFDFGGPSLQIDTACSSSLVALDLAIRSLRAGTCRQALVGGVNVLCHPARTIAYYKAGMLSRRGVCATFDMAADGYVRAEGGVMLLLKPLSKAEQDGDAVYAVIRGCAVNHGGQAGGLTVPQPSRQADLIVAACADANVDPGTISYVEAHGTGTQLGDVVELSGLRQAFDRLQSANVPRRIGSVKTNLGHLEAAAGLVGLLKVVLSLRQAVLPPSLHFDRWNPRLQPEAAAWRLVDHAEPWDADGDGPRRAGVSSFGSGGTNAHIVVEEYRSELAPDDNYAEPVRPVVVPLSAKTDGQLRVLAARLLAAIDAGEVGSKVGDIAATLQSGRRSMERRVAFVCASQPELALQLGRFLAGEPEPAGVFAQDMPHAMSTGDLDDLALRWVSGASVEWLPPVTQRRVHLPTYPFGGQQHWISRTESNASAVSVANGFALCPLAPHDASEEGARSFGATLTGDEFFVADHVIAGQRMLPAAAQVELIRAALRLALPTAPPVLLLSHLSFVLPLALDDGSLDFRLDLEAMEGQGVSFKLRCQAVPASMFAMGHGMFVQVRTADRIDIALLRSRCAPTPMGAADCYQRLGRLGYMFGPSMQSIVELSSGCGPDLDALLALARFKLPAICRDAVKNFELHPSILDSAFQSAVLAQSSGNEAGLRLPFSIASMELRGTLPDTGWIVVTRSASGAALLDVDIAADDGTVCLRIARLSLRAAGGADTAAALRAPLWTEAPLGEPTSAAPQDPAVDWVIACGLPHATVAALAAARPGAHHLSLEPPQSDRDAPIAVRYGKRAARLLEAVRAKLSDPRHPLCRVQLAIPADGDDSVMRGLAGMLKCVAKEDPRLLLQVVALDASATPVQVANWLEAEARSGANEVRRVGEQRHVRLWSEVVVTVAPPLAREGSVVLITGGSGGLGLLVAEAIASETPSARLVLTGRSEPSRELDSKLEALRGFGAWVEYRRADTTDAAAMGALVREIDGALGGLRGVVHAAGVLRDGLARNKHDEDLHYVLAPKVQGLAVLDAVTSGCELDFFVGMASLSGVLGNVGQTDYGAANGFMDAFMEDRARKVSAGLRQGVSVSIDWPLWADGGMRVGDAVRERMWREEGIRPLPSAAGLWALRQALASGRAQVAVLFGDVPRLEDSLHGCAVPAPAPTPQEGDTAAAAMRLLTRIVGERIGVPAVEVRVNEPLERYGIDSIMVMELTVALEKAMGLPMPMTLFFEHRSIGALAAHLARTWPERLQGLSMTAFEPPGEVAEFRIAPTPAGGDGNAPLDIAIIGLAGRYPDAASIDQFWENLAQGRNSVREIPEHRWRSAQHFDAEKGRPGKTYSRWGGFIDGVDEFDPLFFNISPVEAPNIDPQERLFLQCAYETLEDAGVTRAQLTAPDGIAGSVGVFVGVMYSEYQLYGAQAQSFGDGYATLGSVASIANRVSHFCDFNGPSMAIDTMCSSSLTAIHLACQAIARGDCKMAIAGGVNLSVHPNKYLMLAQGRFLSSDGLCRSFGAGGDGYVPGEGVGAVLLKPLKQAIADGDRIQGVIMGSAVNHGGRTNGFTVPNPSAQAKVVAAALERSAVHPRAVSYVEAHGTGTALGDPIEIVGLVQAFGNGTADTAYCAIGSVKSNIGHCESAAGIAGLTKVLLQIRHRMIAGSLHAQQPNPYIEFERTPFVVQRATAPWPGEQPRIACISSFGAGGANAHLVVREHVSDVPPRATTANQTAVVVLSARNVRALLEQARALLEHLDSVPGRQHELADIAYTLQVGRETMESRLACVVADLAGLRDRLRRLMHGEPNIDGLFTGNVARGSADAQRAHAADPRSLAAAWVRGAAVDWRALYAPQAPRRIRLPGHPLAREHYWVAKPTPPGRVVGKRESAMAHPFLQENNSDLFACRFTASFSAAEYFFRDHRLRGKAVVPAALQLEMARGAVAAGLSLRQDGMCRIELRRVNFVRAHVAEGEEVQIAVAVERDRESFMVRLHEHEQARGHDILRTDPIFLGTAVLQDPLAQRSADIGELRSRCAHWVEGPMFYAAMDTLGLNYGPAMRGIERLGLHEKAADSTFVLAKLKGEPPATATRDACELQPWALDSVLQTSLAFMLRSDATADGGLLVPFAIESMQMLCAPAQLTWAVAEVRHGAGSVTCDIDVFSDEGVPQLRIEGLQLREWAGDDAEASEDLLVAPSWDAVPLPDHAAAGAQNAHNMLVCCADDALSAELRACCPAATFVTLSATDDTAGLGRSLQSAQRWRRIVWIAPAAQRTWRDDPSHSVRPGFVFFKALLLSGFGDGSLDLTIVTRQGQDTGSEDFVDPVHAAFQGLAGTIANEYRHWTVRLVDLPVSGFGSPNAWLRLPPGPAPVPWVLRDGRWLRQSWVPYRLGADAPLHRHGGVHVVIGGAGGIGEVYSEHLMRMHGARVIWLGRRTADAAINEKIQRLGALGMPPVYMRVDASDPVALCAARDQIVARFGAVHGVVHSTIVLKDAGLAAMDEAAFRAAFSAKAGVSVAIAHAFRNDQLDAIVVFSSMQSLLMLPGQANYVAGCRFVDAHAAELRRTLRCPVKVMNWGYWGSLGAVATDEYRKRMRVNGFTSIHPPAAMAILDRWMGSEAPQLAFAKTIGTKVAQALDTDVMQTQSMAARSSLRPPVQHAADALHAGVRACVLAALKMEDTQLDDATPLADYGVDSIVSIGVVNRINERFGIRLATSVIFEHPTVEALSRRLAQEGVTATPAVDLPPDEPEIGAAAPAKRAGDQGTVPCRKIVLGRSGDIGELQIAEDEISGPGPGPGEVLVSVRAFSLNFGDLLCMQGLYPTMPPYPFTPGFECAGIVIATGDGVSGLRTGDRVVAVAGLEMGAHATVFKSAANHVHVLPPDLSFEDACAVPVAGMTVLEAFDRASVRAGEWVLIHSAAGGVGLVAMQLTRHLGAQVIATVGSQAKRQHLLDLGLAHVVNLQEQDFAAEVMRITDSRGVDVVVNTLGGNALQKGLGCLAANGRYVELAMTSLKNARSVDLSALTRNQSFISVDLRKLLLDDPAHVGGRIAGVLDAVRRGAIRANVGSVFGFDDCSGAYRHLRSRKSVGKVVVRVNERPRAPAVVAVPDAVAVIGMAGRYAQADSVHELWEALAAGKDLVQDVERWEWPGAERGACSRGGFIRGIDEFDAGFFRISPAEAGYMEPAQRLFLEESWHALEDAGYAGASTSGLRCGVYAGFCGGDYQELFSDGPSQAFWGNASSIVSGRVAYHLNLQGPAVTVDTACSSSLVAVHIATRALLAGEVDLALAGGVFVQNTASFYKRATRANMLSPAGKCHFLDARADGFVPGEGVGVVVLKRVSRALEDGDHIYGIIRGSAINQDGTTNGITAPSGGSQERLQKEAYAAGGIDPRSIQLVEAHGTGTPLGDPIEFDALRRSFETYGASAGTCAIGSVKTNIGHTVAAAGVAGMTKVLLAMEHRLIPPSLHFSKCNPRVDLEGSPFYVNTSLLPWRVPDGQLRRAAVSSFGFGGTNAHLVIEEPPRLLAPSPACATHLVVLSARNADGLRLQAQRLVEHCRAAQVDCGHMSFTLAVGRRHMAHRLGCVVANTFELVECLSAWLSGSPTADLLESDRVEATAPDADTVEREIRGCTGEVNGTERGRRLWRLARMFVAGGEVPLERLFECGEFRRIPLPVHAFQRRRHWIPDAPVLPASTLGLTRPAPGAVIEPLMDALVQRLQALVARVAQMPLEEVRPDDPIEEYGLDSLMVSELNLDLEGSFDGLSKTLFYEMGSLRDVACLLAHEHAQASVDWSHRHPRHLNEERP